MRLSRSDVIEITKLSHHSLRIVVVIINGCNRAPVPGPGGQFPLPADHATAWPAQECQQQPLSLDGHTLRVNRARGDMPSWQQGPTRSAPHGGTGGHAGSAGKMEEHPKVSDPPSGV